MDTPNSIAMGRLLVLQHEFRLELRGFKFQGPSTYNIIRKEFGLTGCREKVYAEFNSMIIMWQATEPWLDETNIQ